MTLQLEQVAADAQDFIAALEAEQLPTDDLAEGGRHFFRFTQNGISVGFGGFEGLGEHVLLRSIVVLPQARGQGIGRRITERLLQHATDLGAQGAYLLTTSASDFFEVIGFKLIPRDGAPSEILATRQASSLCPSTAALMMRPISNLQPDPAAKETVK